MLVLTRKVDQPVRINENIEIRVLEIRGNRVRLGIVAPPDVTIKRQETIDRLEPIAGCSERETGDGEVDAREALDQNSPLEAQALGIPKPSGDMEFSFELIRNPELLYS